MNLPYKKLKVLSLVMGWLYIILLAIGCLFVGAGEVWLAILCFLGQGIIFTIDYFTGWKMLEMLTGRASKEE